MRRVLAAFAAPFVIAAALVLGLTSESTAQTPTQPDIVQNSQWVCTGPQNRNLVRITINQNGSDAVQFRQNCSGRIGRLEVEGDFADCLKVSPPAPAAHDIVIEGGYCNFTGTNTSHQDCIQAGGGQNFDIRNFVFDCGPTGGGNWFIASFNGGQPRNYICTHCAFGSRHNNQIRTPSDAGSGVRDSMVCLSNSGRPTYEPASANMGGNFSPPASECSFAAMLAYVGAEPPPPPPPPPPDPDPTYNPECRPTCDEDIAALEAEVSRLGGIIDAAQTELNRK